MQRPSDPAHSAHSAHSAITAASWLPIIGCYLAGVLAAAQLGKMSALAPLIAADLQLSLTTVAVAISLIEVGGATLGVVAGALASRMGLAGSLLGSLLCLSVAAVGSGLAHSGTALLAWRLLEAVAYLGVVVTAPVLIVRAAMNSGTGTRVGPAMALWSTFVPVGIAFGAWGWSQAAALSDWRTAMFAGAGLSTGALLVAVAWRLRSGSGSRPAADAGSDSGSRSGAGAGPATSLHTAVSGTERPTALRAAAPVHIATWWLSISFGCYAVFEVGLLALLPLYLTREAGLTAAEAGRWTALAALATIAGSAAAALWMRQGGSPRWPVLLALFVPAAMLFGVFTDAPHASTATTAALLAVALNAISGVYPSFAFAWLPRAAGGALQLVRANGIFTQFGASGSLLGPPLMAWFVDRFGWAAAPWLGVALTVPAALFAMKTLRRLQAHPPVLATTAPGP